MAMTATARDNELRNRTMDALIALLVERGEEVLRVAANEVSIPCVDAEGNDRFYNVKISIPRGTRNVNGGYNEYDGYAAAKEYTVDCEEKAAKKKASDEKKAAKIERDKRRREEKQKKEEEGET